MRKIFAFLTVLTLVVSLIPIFSASAAGEEGPPQCCKLRRAVSIDGSPASAGAYVGETASSECVSPVTFPTTKWGLYCTINTLNTVTDYIFIVLIAVVMIFVIMGAFNILMSNGDPEKVKTGQNYIVYAAAGLAVALLARAVPALVKTIMGV
jgi:drug/metabolite transporter (DMT)-like permease